MDQIPYPGPPLSFHLRVNTLFTLLWVSDCLALLLLTENMLAYGLDGKILFASEVGNVRHPLTHLKLKTLAACRTPSKLIQFIRKVFHMPYRYSPGISAWW